MATRVRCGVLRDRGGFVIGRYRFVRSEERSPRKTDDAAAILITDNTRHFAHRPPLAPANWADADHR
jgi:hypothetical protein